ncbi:hypothetical protein [Clostridium guangxiense]|uniref:hypothetical protein n=1 Tax=Clostridium guangxiense TaxID=1662055 RepID=UPI001E55F407|nr:hypothetical protein [Clostridium guangxiense]MCD2347563.1 hypothetical protein [Clostridium guangxiense]
MSIKFKYIIVIAAFVVIVVLLVTGGCIKAAGRADDWKDAIEQRVGSKKRKH